MMLLIFLAKNKNFFIVLVKKNCEFFFCFGSCLCCLFVFYISQGLNTSTIKRYWPMSSYDV